MVKTLLLISVLFISIIIICFGCKHIQECNKATFLIMSLLFTVSISINVIWFPKELLSLLWMMPLIGYLLFGIYMDIKEQQYYAFIHYPFMALGILKLWLSGMSFTNIVIIILFNSLLQFLVFRNKYGMADCKMFFALSLFYSYDRFPFDFIVISCFHVLLSLAIFLIYNKAKGNMNGLKLKTSMEFIPSIALAAIFFI